MQTSTSRVLQCACCALALSAGLHSRESVFAQTPQNRFIGGGHSLSAASPQFGVSAGRVARGQVPNQYSPLAYQTPGPPIPMVTPNRNPGAVLNVNPSAGPGYLAPNIPANAPRNWQNVAPVNPYARGYNLPTRNPQPSAYPPNPGYQQPLAYQQPLSYQQSGVMPPIGNGIAIPETYQAVPCVECIHTWKLFPNDLLYKSYLAGPLEPRMGQMWLKDEERGSWIWDAAIGGRIGVIRKGTFAPYVSEGWQLDIEGAVFPRFDLDKNGDLESAVFRYGIPLTYRNGRTGLKIGTYHLRAHLGDEFLARVPGFARNNYEKAGFVLGTDYYLSVDTRLYGEISYAFVSRGAAEQWEFQFGGEYSPAECFEFEGRPFLAVNFYLRQEVDYRDGFNAVAGWQWSNPVNGRRFRVGIQYYNGKSMQFTFLNRDEELLGFGVWYDY